MAVQISTELLKKSTFLRGLNDEDLAQIATICGEQSYGIGELCQKEGQPSSRVNLIIEGRVGTVVRIPNVTYCSSEIILDTLHEGDMFGWSSLIKGTPWSTLRVLEPTRILYLEAEDLVNLCEKNYRIGYILMKNLATLIASRLRRNRMSTLNTIVAIKGEG